MLLLRTPTNNSWFSQRVTLDSTTLILELRWNTRNDSWMYSIYDDAGDPIITGRRISINYPLTFRYDDDRLPEGNIWCIRTDSKAKGITRDNLGTKYKLIYITREEEESA